MIGRRIVVREYGFVALIALVTVLSGTCSKKPTVSEILETTVSGRVVDAESGKPIANATVSSEPPTEQVLTNAEGAYSLRTNVVIGKTYRITASATGYMQNTTEAVAREGENRIADLRLSPSSPELRVSPDSLHFDSNSSTGILVIHNAGTGVLTWNVTASEPWLMVSLPSGKSTFAVKF